MRRLPTLVGLALLGLSLIVTTSVSQDAKKDKDDKKDKIKGMLPAGFKDLGLSKEQVNQIYKIQTEYNAKIKELQSKIDEMKKQKTQEEFKVLTPDQRKKYLEAKGVDTKDKTPPKDKAAEKKDAKTPDKN